MADERVAWWAERKVYCSVWHLADDSAAEMVELRVERWALVMVEMLAASTVGEKAVSTVARWGVRGVGMLVAMRVVVTVVSWAGEKVDEMDEISVVSSAVEKAD